MAGVQTCFRRLKPYVGFFKWCVALALLGYLFYENIYRNRDVLGQIANRGLHVFYCLAAFTLCAASALLTMVRWYLLVWAQEFHFRLRDAFRLGFLGMLLNYVAPGQVGGDLFKAALIAREQQSRRLAAVATVIIDRVLGLLALFLVCASVSLFLPGLREDPVLATIAGLMWVGAIAGCLGLVVMLHPATARSRWLNRLVHLRYVGRAIGELIHAVVLYQTKRRVVTLAVAISVVAHVGMLSSFYLCSRTLRLGKAAPDYPTHLLIVPAAEVGASFIPLPGGVGVLEGAMSYFYGVAEANSSQLYDPEWTGPPPEWREALQAFASNIGLWPRVSEHVSTDDGNAFAQAAAETARGPSEDAVRFFDAGGPFVSADAARAMYKAGHRELAEVGGLLAAILFRLITLCIAAAGFVFYVSAKTELAAAMKSSIETPGNPRPQQAVE